MPTPLLVPHALPHRECVSPDERLPWDEGTQRRPRGSPLVPRRPQRVNRPLVPLCTPPTPSAAERPCAGRPQLKRVLHRWRREGGCQQEDSVRRSTAPCAHNQPRSPRSHEVHVRSAQSCLTQLTRLNLAAGRQSARRRSHALISGHRRPPPASRLTSGTWDGPSEVGDECQHAVMAIAHDVVRGVPGMKGEMLLDRDAAPRAGERGGLHQGGQRMGTGTVRRRMAAGRRRRRCAPSR